MTTHTNPFRVNLETIHTCQRLRPERVEQLVKYMWAIFDDTDDLSVDLVGDNASTTWDFFLTFIDDPQFVNDEWDDVQDITVDETIAVFERLAPQFDALSDDDDRGLDLKHIDAHTTILPLS